MDQYFNNKQTEVLYQLLANPADTGYLYTNDLQDLVNQFPQSGFLHALLAHADGQQNINTAAAYFSNKALFKLINSPEGLAEVLDVQIITQQYALNDSNGTELNTTPDTDNYTTVIEDDSATEYPFNVITEDIEQSPQQITQPEISQEELAAPAPNEVLYPVDEVYEEVQPAPIMQVIPPEHNFTEEPILNEEEDSRLNPADEITQPFEITEIPVEDNKDTEPGQIVEKQISPEFTFNDQEHTADIDDEIFDEIVAIEDIRFSEVGITEATAVESSETGKEIASLPDDDAPKDRLLDLNDEAEKLIVGNIAATDYFVFDRAISERKQNESVENEAQQSPSTANGQVQEVQHAADTQHVSKYHDDKMPYTFMWWLDKTRKEHAGMYQPYVKQGTQAISQSRPDELQQQYFENIFHLNSVEELDRSTARQTIEFDMDRKEDIIIKRFIREEPHIKPPSNDKLDNENKAKKSAEDQDGMVTETLARIYTDQMLYHKAINTYKKLILKFPEKSRYFADQIEQLQRKTN